MNLIDKTVVITGGSAGIGFSMAKLFMERNCRVIICGRREVKLAEAARLLPGIVTIRCDVSDGPSRKEFASRVQESFGSIDLLVNNAGIQRDINLTAGTRDLTKGNDEIGINIEGPVHMTAELLPLLKKSSDAAVVNVSSVLAFVPMVRVPLYCATKAFLHSYTLSLRQQFASIGIKVFEIMPPRVETELNAEGRKRAGYAGSGIDADFFAGIAVGGIEADQPEIEYEENGRFRDLSRQDLDDTFLKINNSTYNWD